mmetsp:Transcript_25378/g.64499  ORF Transcript_25378/g.64499 Transcript_25378/m.64499 type:complete len:94 (-) Transcript_25378:255-536(-)|eukprot:CAMPEP_0115870992 /NCGR_PEP_ID=MMETSP0287-20121206/22627_1 /TAXON_ID=412157 /ORGANISM="Chrysochromulina rotalis, Strain UIO044" /LENGTH=93 /DNA_ID=CAMNT_0003325761 /DNA_START=359 /DNA_END=640 /DNA_ORIENTATION=+
MTSVETSLERLDLDVTFLECALDEGDGSKATPSSAIPGGKPGGNGSLTCRRTFAASHGNGMIDCGDGDKSSRIVDAGCDALFATMSRLDGSGM